MSYESYERCWYLQDKHNTEKMTQKQLRINMQREALFAFEVQLGVLQRDKILLKVGTKS